MKNLMNTDWLNREEYPFNSNFMETKSGKIHYIDEGEGEVLLFVHGNPNWSFGYRELIKHFSKTHRCIAIDHLGFGLSDKPYDVSYLPQFHAENLESVIRALGLRDITLVMHDWGGPIGMSYAENNPSNVKRLIVFNSWFWSVKEDKTLRSFSKFIGSALGRNLCKYFNFFPRVLMKMDVGDKKKYSKAVHRHYIEPFPHPETRKGTWVFPKSFLAEDRWLNLLWDNKDSLRELPVLLLWGLKDKAFPEPFLSRWESTFPGSTTAKFEYSGHNSPEDIGKEAIEFVQNFLEAKN
ncbi:alpha/beta fold hydrolase [Chryseobacterium sp. CBSDS_008]|uniref:alpha/beta fold hydrolase n=1 Tax=Chryseobacterium sp. CBSDS_008 TaxID=3415265 RepID=UPI003CF7F298